MQDAIDQHEDDVADALLEAARVDDPQATSGIIPFRVSDAVIESHIQGHLDWMDEDEDGLQTGSSVAFFLQEIEIEIAIVLAMERIIDEIGFFGFDDERMEIGTFALPHYARMRDAKGWASVPGAAAIAEAVHDAARPKWEDGNNGLLFENWSANPANDDKDYGDWLIDLVEFYRDNGGTVTSEFQAEPIDWPHGSNFSSQSAEQQFATLNEASRQFDRLKLRIRQCRPRRRPRPHRTDPEFR